MKKLIPILIIFIFTNFAKSDDKSEPVGSGETATGAKSKKVFVGGDIGVTFGDYTEVRIAPMIGYMFSPQVFGAVEFVYRHSWDKILNQNTAIESTIQSNSIGGSAFIQYYPIRDAYLKTEFSYQVYKTSTTQNLTESVNVPFLFLGLGYTRHVNNNLYFNAGIKVDVLNNQNSPFEDFTPFFDVGIGVGI